MIYSRKGSGANAGGKRTEVTASEIPAIQRAFTDAWSLLKRYYHIGQEDNEEWERLIADYRSMCKSEEPLAKELASVVLRYLGERSKR